MTKQDVEKQYEAAKRNYERFSEKMPNSSATAKMKEKMDILKVRLDEMTEPAKPIQAPAEGKKRGRPAKAKPAEAPAEDKKRGRPAKAKPAIKDVEKMSRFVFEKEVEGGKMVEVVFAESKESAIKSVEDGFVFSRQIMRGRSPKTGFIAGEGVATIRAVKKEEVKVAETPKRGRPSKKMTAEDAGIKIEDSRKRATKVEKKKTKGRGRPKSTRFFLFEMPLKTSGKFKRKIQVASSIENAKKRIGDSYVFVKEVTAITGEGTFDKSIAGLETAKPTAAPAIPTVKANKKDVIVAKMREAATKRQESRKAAKPETSVMAQLTQDEIRALKAFAQALMRAKFEKGGMTSDDWGDLFANLPVVRTQFEEEDYEFEDGGFVK